MSEEDIVAQDHRRRRPIQKRFTKRIGLSEPIGAALSDIGQGEPPLASVAEQAFELLLVLRRGDDGNLAQAGQHQNREGIVDHRFVVDRQQLL